VFGSGKTISAVRQAFVEAERNKVLTNFAIKGIKNHYRLKKGDILKDVSENPKKKEFEVNWDFWENNKNCDIFLDEVHNLINSRNSMSKENKKYSEWVAQIRKVWGSSGDQNYLEALKRMPNNLFHRLHQRIYSKSNNIFFITQKPRKLDVNIKDLVHVHIQCSKQKIKGKTVIFQNHFLGNDNESGIEMMEYGAKPKITYFTADPYFGKYDSYEIIKGEYI